jgi:hypothetical protein
VAALVSSYLFPRHRRVGCGDDPASLAPLVAGVPQDSPILPLCFFLFTDDMTEVLEFSKFTTAGRRICSQNVLICEEFLSGLVLIF